MAFWKSAENPGARPLRSWAFDIGCAIFAGAASLARFSFGQTAHSSHLSPLAGLIVVVLTAGALPLRRVWPGPVFVWTLLAVAVLAQWPAHGALFPVALGISLYTVATTMRRAEALAAAVLTTGVLLLVVAQDGTRHWALAISDAVRVHGRCPVRGAVRADPPGVSRELSDRARRLERERVQTSALARRRRNEPASPARCMTVWRTTSPSSWRCLDGALRAVTRAPGEASDAIRDVAGTARQALAETRQLLGVLRADSGHEPGQPLPAWPAWTISSAGSGLFPACRSATNAPASAPAPTRRPASSSPSSGSCRRP